MTKNVIMQILFYALLGKFDTFFKTFEQNMKNSNFASANFLFYDLPLKMAQ